jgi:hypothetical protein
VVFTFFCVCHHSDQIAGDTEHPGPGQNRLQETGRRGEAQRRDLQVWFVPCLDFVLLFASSVLHVVVALIPEAVNLALDSFLFPSTLSLLDTMWFVVLFLS